MSHNITINQNTDSLSQIELDNLLLLYQKGMHKEALSIARQISNKFPNHPFAFKLLGVLYLDKNLIDEALDANFKAVRLSSQDSEAYNNLGTCLQKSGRLDESVESYEKAILLKPDIPEYHYNLGVSFKLQGKLDKAISCYQKTILLKPEFTPAYNNIGNILLKLERLEEAKICFKKATILNPSYTEAFNNLAVTLHKMGQLAEASENYKKAIELNPQYAQALSNLGVTMLEMGMINQAITYLSKAITIIPDYKEAWKNIYYSIQVIKNEEKFKGDIIDNIFLNDSPRLNQVQLALLKYQLNEGSKNSNSVLSNTLKVIHPKADIKVKNNKFLIKRKKLNHSLPKNVIALIHFGRSGTGLLHSLVDNHSEVSSLPSIYFSEFFDGENWKKITSKGLDGLIENFIDSYPVFFDSRSSFPVPSNADLIESLGVREGMTNLGENKNEFLIVDKNKFRTLCKDLLSQYEYVDQITFFKIIHVVYEKIINKEKTFKNNIFYHIHNPDPYAKLNFIRSAPETKWLMTARNPVENCESWISEPFFNDSTYERVALRIVTMLFDIDNTIFVGKNAVAVRLEDLKEKPQKTIKSLCKWIGIKEEKSLYQMTAQGKRWWGDKTTPNMTAFGKVNKSKVGNIFSANDIYILKTLFYPFCVKFKYVDDNMEKFKHDLKIIRPMLDKVFDFEKDFAASKGINLKFFIKSGTYRFLRTKMIERWQTLNNHNTYPNMIKPLILNDFDVC